MRTILYLHKDIDHILVNILPIHWQLTRSLFFEQFQFVYIQRFLVHAYVLLCETAIAWLEFLLLLLLLSFSIHSNFIWFYKGPPLKNQTPTTQINKMEMETENVKKKQWACIYLNFILRFIFSFKWEWGMCAKQ